MENIFFDRGGRRKNGKSGGKSGVANFSTIFQISLRSILSLKIKYDYELERSFMFNLVWFMYV